MIARLCANKVLVPELHHQSGCKADRIDHYCWGAWSCTTELPMAVLGQRQFLFYTHTHTHTHIGIHSQNHTHAHRRRPKYAHMHTHDPVHWESTLVLNVPVVYFFVWQAVIRQRTYFSRTSEFHWFPKINRTVSARVSQLGVEYFSDDLHILCIQCYVTISTRSRFTTN